MHGRGRVWQGGMYGKGGGMRGGGRVVGGPACGRYASYWNAFLFTDGDQQLNGRMQRTEVRTICYVESFTRYNIF